MSQQYEQEPLAMETSRRKFLQLAALGGGASLWATSPSMAEERPAGAIDALLLSCMDYRLINDVEHYMSSRGLREKYDHIVLAGASLGAITDKFPAWNETFWQHLDIAIKLHHIHTVLLMDHRDCGAYKIILGAEHANDPKVEKETHAAQLKKLKGMIIEKYPKLRVETLLMAIDGKVETVG